MPAPKLATTAFEIAIPTGKSGYINVIKGSLRFTYSANAPSIDPYYCAEITAYGEAIEFGESPTRGNILVAKTSSSDVEYFVNLIDDEISGA